MLAVMVKVTVVAALMFSICVGMSDNALAASAPDASILTQYTAPKGKSIIWSVCGAVPNAQGCFDTGTFAGLTQPCSITEGVKQVVSDTPSQYVTSTQIYVLDEGSATADKLKLDVYTKLQNTQSSAVTTTFTLNSTVTLPVTGGPTAVCSMAANQSTLAAGTNVDPNAVLVNLRNLRVTSIGTFYPPIDLSAITESENGYISLQYGSGSNSASIIIDPYGAGGQSGGGSAMLLNPRSAVSLNSTGSFSGLAVQAKPTFQLLQ